MQDRIVSPEILDSLSPDDPDAIKSRRDLQRIDFFMGNSRWILQKVKQLVRPGDHLVEIGAGGGHLGMAMAGRLSREVRYTGCDLVPRPQGWPARYDWRQGDIFTGTMPADATVMVASLLLHHFQAPQLALLGKFCQQLRLVIAVEPVRRSLHLWQGRLLRITGTSHVTDHDLAVSVRAGFRGQELADALDLSPGKGWVSEVSETWLGAHRLLASREAGCPIC